MRDVNKIEKPNIVQQLEDICEEICDNYCKWPAMYDDQQKMWEEKCEKCVLNKLS